MNDFITIQARRTRKYSIFMLKNIHGRAARKLNKQHIKVNLTEFGCHYVKWMEVVQGRAKACFCGDGD